MQHSRQPHGPRPPTLLHAVGGLALALALATAMILVPASAQAKPKVEAKPRMPQLSIAVDNGHSSLQKGDKLTYTITLTNLGPDDVHQLLVTQTVPAGSRLVSVNQGGKSETGKVSWKRDLKAAKSATFRTTLSVAATPDQLLRLATVACAALSVKKPPIVCASDSDELPAGAAARAEEAALKASAQSPSGSRIWWLVGGGIGVVGLLVALSVLLVRRRHP